MGATGLSRDEASAKIRSWQEKEKDFVRQTGLKKQGGRSQIGGYSRSDSIKIRGGAERYYQHWIRGISQEGNPRKLADYYDMKYNNHKEYDLLKRVYECC